MDDEIAVLVTIATDNRIAGTIHGVGMIILTDGVGTQQQFADHGPYSPLNDAWLAIAMADQLVVPNKWTIDTLRRLSSTPRDKLDAAIDLQVLARTIQPHFHSYGLDACAQRMGWKRTGFRGSPVWTEDAMDAVRRDVLICFDLYHHLGCLVDGEV